MSKMPSNSGKKIFHQGAWLGRQIASKVGTRVAFSGITGITRGTLRKWIDAEIIPWRDANRAAVAQGLGMPLERFDAEMEEARKAYEQPLEIDQNIAPADGEIERAKASMRPVRILNYITAGPLMDERMLGFMRTGYVEAPVGDVPTFALWVQGDSMEPRYRNGDLVIFEAVDAQSHRIREGCDYAVQLDGDHFYEQTFKRLYNDPAEGENIVIAKALNPKTKPRKMRIPRLRIHRLGIVRWVLPCQG